MRKTVLVNGLNSKTGGGKGILAHYMSFLENINSENIYFIITPDSNDIEAFYPKRNIILIPTNKILSSTFLAPFMYFIFIPIILRRIKASIVINLGDIPIRSDCYQVLIFDWAYAVYDIPELWSNMPLKEWLVRKLKIELFKKHLNYVSKLYAQTTTVGRKLEEVYGLKNVSIMPNSVTIEPTKSTVNNALCLPDGIKLLYLTHYYTHKNIEIFIPLAKKIKKHGLNFKIIITLDSKHHKNAEILLNAILSESLDDVIINIGPVNSIHIENLYERCDALLMPSLLESFSTSYVEAMRFGVPIFTSDRDYAKEVCGDAAFYFDPLDADNILHVIEEAFLNKKGLEEKIRYGYKRFESLPNWFVSFNNLEKLIGTVE